MQCPKCQLEQNDLNQECCQCGVIFSKYHEWKGRKEAPLELENSEDNFEGNNSLWKLLFSSPDVGVVSFTGRVLVYLFLLVWGVKFMFASIDSNYAGHSFMHLINLPFHEAGHLLFRPFGSFITSLGGSLAQILMPLLCLAVLLVQTRDAFGASVCLWWFGQNFFDLAPYINDARAGVLPLVGGNYGHSSPYGFHDYHYLLNESGLLHYDHLIAGLVTTVGTMLMCAALIWGGYLLLVQFRILRK